MARRDEDEAMSRPNPAQEPSMDEILASIRKIIADDPVGSAREPDDAAAAPLTGATRAHADPGEFELP